MEKLLLIRHGESIANKAGIIQGKSDFVLSSDGIKDVQKLVTENYDILKKYNRIISGPQKRAIQTANIVKENTNFDISYDKLLEEVGAGILEGLKKDFVKENYPEYFKTWSARDDLDTIPGAEKGDEIQARVLMFLERYLYCDSNDIIVSHAGLFRSLINTIMFRDRRTNIDLGHNKIYCLEDVWKNIPISECEIAKNSRVFKIETYDKKYIMKKINKTSLESEYKEKQLLDYLSKQISTPNVIGLSKHDNYILKIMNYAEGVNINQTLNKVKINNTTKELYKLKQLLKIYENSFEYDSCNIIDEFNKILATINDEEVKKIIQKILVDESFEKYLINDSIQLVHDDLHRYNILYNQNEPIFLDFDGIKKWPSTYQLASYIAANYLLYDNDFNFDVVLNKWPEKIDVNYLENLILFRLVKGFSYFEKRINSNIYTDDDIQLKQTYKNSILKIKKGDL